MSFKSVRFILSKILLAQAISFVLPLIFCFIYNEPHINFMSFGIMAIGSIIVSILLGIKTGHVELGAKEGLVSVALAWLLVSLVGALPYFISGTIPNYFDAFFETASGFTTTGASILTTYEGVAKSMLFYRALTQWIGGIGILVFLLTILTEKNEKNSIHLLRAESTGVEVGKLTSKMKISTRILIAIYVSLTALEFVLLAFDPSMPIFDAICISLATTATGGFSTGVVFSVYAQYVIAVIMLLSGINFTVYYLIFAKKARQAFRNEEFIGYLIVIALTTVLIFINTFKIYNNIEETFRNSFFTVTSLITTTGFGTVDFTTWPTFSKTLLVIIMLIGSCAGSTAGGIKISRMIIMSKNNYNRIKNKSSENSVSVTKLNKQVVSDNAIQEVNVFIITYIAILFICTVVLSLNDIEGLEFFDYFTASLTSISNVGPGLTSPIGPFGNFSIFSNFSKVVMSIEMLIGRLELFPILALFNYRTYRKF